MDYDTFLSRIPKVELHCHLGGTIRPTTVVEMARKNDIPLPTYDPWNIYVYPKSKELEHYLIVSRSIVTRGDFARVAYESLHDAVETSNVRHREMFFNPTSHLAQGILYREMIDGLVEGIAAAESDLGIRCLLIPSIRREDGPEAAVDMVREVLAHRRDEVVGLGMDGLEALRPPERFAEAYRLAREAGLRCTSHVAEDGPARNVITCLDELGCERLDHGYRVLRDAAVIERVRHEQVPFTCKFSLRCDWRNHPVKEMVAQGLKVTINPDGYHHERQTLATEYVDTATVFDYDADQMVALCLNGVDAAWVDDSERRQMRRLFLGEIDALRAALTDDRPPRFVPYYRSGTDNW